MKTIELPSCQEEVEAAIKELRLQQKQLDLQTAMIRAQLRIIREQVCEHPNMYVKNYYDGSSSSVCPVCDYTC